MYKKNGERGEQGTNSYKWRQNAKKNVPQFEKWGTSGEQHWGTIWGTTLGNNMRMASERQKKTFPSLKIWGTMIEEMGNRFIDENIGLVTYKMTMKKAQLDEEIIVAGLNIKIACLYKGAVSSRLCK